MGVSREFRRHLCCSRELPRMRELPTPSRYSYPTKLILTYLWGNTAMGTGSRSQSIHGLLLKEKPERGRLVLERPLGWIGGRKEPLLPAHRGIGPQVRSVVDERFTRRHREPPLRYSAINLETVFGECRLYWRRLDRNPLRLEPSLPSRV